MPSLGARVSDYEVWGLLGEGGMSEVWLAKHTVLAVPVVIKTVRAALAGQDATERVLGEARLMARIADPRVVRALDAGVHEGTPYLVEEYVDGIDLEELDRRRRESLGVGLPLWFTCEVLKQTCRALHGAHQAGVIHRDVKPSNVFGSPETGIRVGDFGIAIAGSDRRVRDTGGTLAYMAPEQLRGEHVDRAADVYGAAVTAYVLRYGRAPFASPDEVLDPDRRPSFPEPQHLAEGYFQQLLRTMMEKDAEKRPRCAAHCARHFGTVARSVRSPGSASAQVVAKNAFRILGCEVTLEVGDIARAVADGIVCSSYDGMRMRSGVGEALRRAGGNEIEEEALASGSHALGSCVATTAGRLSARHVLHAVSAWNETSCVGRATQRAYLLAESLGLRTLAMPALGTGAARVSLEISAKATMTALRWHLALGGSRLAKVRVVLDSEEKLQVYRSVVEDALRDEEEAPGLLDLGLPDQGTSIRGDSATHIDVHGVQSGEVASG